MGERFKQIGFWFLFAIGMTVIVGGTILFIYCSLYMDREKVVYNDEYFIGKVLPHHHVMNNLAIALYMNGRYEEAKVVGLKALEARADIYRNKFKTYGVLAEIFIQLGEDGKAIEALQRAMAIEPHWPILYQRLSILMLHYGQKENARKVMQVRLTLDPNSEIGWKIYDYLVR